MATPDQQVETMLANLPEKTGRPIDDWLALIAAASLEKHGQIVAFLKAEHGVSHGFANLIAVKALEGDAASPEDPLAAIYAGPKAGLRALHDAIVDYATGLGTDVEIAPKKSSVSLRRAKQFALIAPASRTRIDLGLALKGVTPTERLEAWNAMCSHRVRLERPADFDETVRGWMVEAYTRAG